NVVGADTIYVLDKGNIVEKGSHRQLVDKKGTYAALWEAQQSLEHYGEARKPHNDHGKVRSQNAGDDRKGGGQV
ncbi:MAG: hypothetical protein J6I64_06475, partial [Lachnospiraceae bacterium]|nr:hypothetical protein [Lachnospiraceae bacterium]